VQIISTWIDYDGEGETASFAELWAKIVYEVHHCDRLVVYAEPGDFPLKGTLVEIGIALHAQKEVKVVVPNTDFLNPHNLNPLGSWAYHEYVELCTDLDYALGVQDDPSK
jgi:hypothetical protein